MGKSFFRGFILATLTLSLTFFGLISCTDDDSGGGSSYSPPVLDPDVTALGAPKFSPVGGFFNEPQTLTITCTDDPGAAIYYYILKRQDTEDDWNAELTASNFSADNNNYTGRKAYTPDTKPTIDCECIVRAVAIKSDGTKTYSMTAFDFPRKKPDGTAISNSTEEKITRPWEDESIYFILTDRFAKGTTSSTVTPAQFPNNTPTIPASYGSDDGYCGGNLSGIKDKLDYIKGMGFTAIFITPPTLSLEVGESYHGYHGYWTSDWMAIDPHMGTIDEYKALVTAAHTEGLRVIQDFNINNTGDYMEVTSDHGQTYDGLGARDVTISTRAPLNHPAQLPWALNNINNLNAGEYAGRFYNYKTRATSNTTGFEDYQLEGLDDLYTSSKVVKSLLQGYARYWIDKVGIDGFRLNNAYGVQKGFLKDFVNSTTEGQEGVLQYGNTKRGGFLVFGENQAVDESPNDAIAASRTSSGSVPLTGGAQYTTLRHALKSAIADGNAQSLKTTLENRTTSGYSDLGRLVSFIDNHDTERWAVTAGSSTTMGAKEKAAYNVIFSIPGIPCVYYGSEQGLKEKRTPLFSQSVYGSTTDTYTTSGDRYKYFTALNAMRKDLRVFRHSVITVAAAQDALYAQVLDEEVNGNLYSNEPGRKAIVIHNAGSTTKNIDLGPYLKAGEVYKLIDGLAVEGTAANDNGAPYTITSATTGSGKYENISVKGVTDALPDEIEVKAITGQSKKCAATLKVGPNTCAIYLLCETKDAPVEIGGAVLEIATGSGGTNTVITGDNDKVIIKGKSSAAGTVKALIDGSVEAGTATAVANTQFEIDCGVMPNLSYGAHTVCLTQEVDSATYISSEITIQVVRPFKFQQGVVDKQNDGNGVSNSSLSLDSSDKGVTLPLYNEEDDGLITGTQDLRGVEVYTSGTNIRLGLRMDQISNKWSPSPNSFDHVMFYVFINTTGTGTDSGCDVLPNGHYTLPSDFGKWNYLYVCDGWSNRIYESTDATTANWGTPSSPVPSNKPGISWEGVRLFTSDQGKSYNFATLREKWEPWISATVSSPVVAKGTAWPTDSTPPAGHNISGIIWLDIPAATFGSPTSLAGIKILVATYDADSGKPRELVAAGGADDSAKAWKFLTEGTPSSVPMLTDVLDEVITLE